MCDLRQYTAGPAALIRVPWLLFTAAIQVSSQNRP